MLCPYVLSELATAALGSRGRHVTPAGQLEHCNLHPHPPTPRLPPRPTTTIIGSGLGKDGSLGMRRTMGKEHRLKVLPHLARWSFEKRSISEERGNMKIFAGTNFSKQLEQSSSVSQIISGILLLSLSNVSVRFAYREFL